MLPCYGVLLPPFHPSPGFLPFSLLASSFFLSPTTRHSFIFFSSSTSHTFHQSYYSVPLYVFEPFIFTDHL